MEKCSLFNSPEQLQPCVADFDHWLAQLNNASPSCSNPDHFVRNGVALGELEGYSCPKTPPPAGLALGGSNFLPALEGGEIDCEKPLVWAYYNALIGRLQIGRYLWMRSVDAPGDLC